MEREDKGDQKALLVSDDARLRVDVELRDDAVLRTDEAVLFAVLWREESRRFMIGASSCTSGDGGGEGYTLCDTQLGSSSWLDDPSSESS